MELRDLIRIAIVDVVVLGVQLLGATGQTTLAQQANFSVFPSSPSINDIVEFDASTVMQAVSYEWDFNSDGEVDFVSEDPEARHFFEDSGDIQVTLHMTDRFDERESLRQTVRVSDAPVKVRRTFDSSFSPNQVPAGGSLFVDVTIEVRADVSGLGLSEQLPAGWRALPLNDGGSIFKRTADELQWLWATTMLAGESVSVRYELIVPSSISRGNYQLNGTVSSFLPVRFKLPVSSLNGLKVF